MLTMDPSHPEQERELEQLYLNFAQPNNLAMKQCMVVGLNVGRSSSAQEWTGSFLAGVAPGICLASRILLRQQDCEIGYGQQQSWALGTLLASGCCRHGSSRAPL